MLLKTLIKSIIETKTLYVRCVTTASDVHYERVILDYTDNTNSFADSYEEIQKWEKQGTKVRFVSYNTALKMLQVDCDIMKESDSE